MRKNVGTTDALIRITGGLLGLAYGIGKMSRRPYNAPWLLMAFSAMKVAEGITRHCPMYRAMGINTRSEKGMQDMWSQAKDKGVQMVMKQVTRTLNARKDESTPASQQQHTAASAAHEAARTKDRKLSPEDERLEKAAREFVSYRSEDKDEHRTDSTHEKNQSDQYSHDEHRYPTYF